MKKIILITLLAVSVSAAAQNNTAAHLIEGSKSLAELVRIFKTPKSSMSQYTSSQLKDSCAIKGLTDFCVKNNTGKPLLVSIYRRNESGYDAAVLFLRVLPQNKEWLYAIKSGIYKIKTETEEAGVKKPFKEGEIKINSCENPVKTFQH
ncbi:MAG: hypothetical protein WKF88_01790 [Ferruginibacter sp.]